MNPSLCYLCGAAGQVERQWDGPAALVRIGCPNRATISERRYNRKGKCLNCSPRWCADLTSAIKSWNLKNERGTAMREARHYHREEHEEAPPRCPRCSLALGDDGTCLACPGERHYVDRFALARNGEQQTERA